MKTKPVAILIVIFVTLITGCKIRNSEETNNRFPLIKGPYLGQKPPGDIPELFAPGIIADIHREHSATKFSPHGKEVFWNRVINEGSSSRIDIILHMKLENGIWSEPELAPFNNGLFNHLSSISPDGNRIYFTSSARTEPDGKFKSSSWIVDKTENGWGEPRLNNLIPDWEYLVGACQKTKSGNIYFQSNNVQNVDLGIGFLRSKFINGKYQEPEVLSKSINSEYLDYAFYVDPDEKFIIFSSVRPGGFTETDLYICYYNQDDDSWSEAINLGEKINTVGDDFTSWAHISPDGKYLFFVAAKKINIDGEINKYTYAEIIINNGFGKIYWVNTNFIEELKPEHLK